MKRAGPLVIVIAFLLRISGASSAQDAAFQCSAEDMLASISRSEEALNQAQTSATNGDLQAAFDALKQISEEITSTETQCRGWNFIGTSSDALGPLQLEAGVYILEYTAIVEEGAFVMGALVIQFENLDEEEFVFDSVLETYDEAGEHSGRKTVRLEGGRYLISVEPGGISNWTIALTKP